MTWIETVSPAASEQVREILQKLEDLYPREYDLSRRVADALGVGKE